MTAIRLNGRCQRSRIAASRFERADKNKSALYLEALPLFMRGAIRIPDLPILTRELRLLERQTHRSGRDTVDHGRHGSDDFVNALCGCAAYATGRANMHMTRRWNGSAEVRRRQLRGRQGCRKCPHVGSKMSG